MEINEAGGRQPKLFGSFFSSFFLPLLAVSRLLGFQARSQAVLFALWMTVRKLTRLLVFEMYACDHTWKKDLQQWALAGGLWLFIPSFPKAIGLFFFREHTIYLGAGRKGADLQRVTGGEGWGWGAFQILFKPSEPSLSWAAVISKGLCTDLMERVFVYLYLWFWLFLYQFNNISYYYSKYCISVIK